MNFVLHVHLYSCHHPSTRSDGRVRLSCRLAAPPHPAGSPEQGDLRPVPVPDLPSLRPALAGVGRSGLLCDRLGHLHRRDEAHLLCARRGDHAAHHPAGKLQRKTCLCLFLSPGFGLLLLSALSALECFVADIKSCCRGHTSPL